MLRNCNRLLTLRTSPCILNEVLSLNAQESSAYLRYSNHRLLLNEVLSLNAQECERMVEPNTTRQ